MRYLLLAVFAFACTLTVRAQDFSNKGKDFWVGYGLHSRMFQNNTGGTQDMVLYFATEAVTNVTVSIPSLGYSQTYSNIAANTIFTTSPIPKTGTQDARLTTEGTSNKGIHIVASQPIVAYAHIYNGNVSGATLLFPTQTLGKDYYSINFEEHSNEANSNCFFYAVAVDTGTTTIEVVPSANTQTMVGGQSYTFNLTQGQVFNALGQFAGNDGVDLTGSRIRSISVNGAGGGCKRIAVFSGAGKINIKCPVGAGGGSADNYMCQAFPKTAWGQNYLTVPTKQMPYNYFRIAVSNPATVVKVNGITQTNLINGFYYQVGQTNQPSLITADQPVMVAQYITTAGVCGNTAIGSNGDPEVIYLSPVEQNISKVILNSTPNFSILANQHYVNVVIPNGGTAISSFKIDGLTPSTAFVTHPGNSNYSYLTQNVTPGAHTLTSDSGFNAIAYGYGNAESYGYNAGANVKDLYQFVSIKNQYATVSFPAACRNSPFYFSMTFPYQPTKITWNFGGLFTNVVINNPVYDSTWVVNGKNLYRYTITQPYTITALGTYPIKVLAENPTPDGCPGEQEIDYDLQVFERPVADFNITNTGCIADSVRFADNSTLNGRPAILYNYSFGDGGTSGIKNPAHLYTAPGTYPVRYSVITDIGCLSDTVEKQVIITTPPIGNFGFTQPGCATQQVTFTDSSTSPTSPIVSWVWDFGDGNTVTASSNAAQTHTYASPGTYTVTLKLTSAIGCLSQPFSKTVVINAKPVPDFSFGNACLPTGQMNFTNQSTISDGSQAQLLYGWDFGDNGTSTQASPSHNYAAVGPYIVKLVVTSNNGCKDSVSKSVNTVYAQPIAQFNAPASVCDRTNVSFTDQSSAAASTVTAWNWSFGDNTNSTQQSPTHTYAAPGNYTVTLTVTSAIGCLSAPVSKIVHVDSLPTAGFTNTAPLCEGLSVSFTDTSKANSGTLVQWTWYMGDGTQQNLASPAISPYTYSQAGSYPVRLTVKSNRGCVSDTITKTLVIHVNPEAGFIVPGNCITDPFSQFTDTSKISDGTASQFVYAWTFGDANATPSNPNTSTIKDPKHSYTATGTYTVRQIVTSAAGCKDTATNSFFINGAQPQSVFNIQGGNQHCSNLPVKLNDASNVDFGNLVKLEIFWDDANDPTIKTVQTFPTANASYQHIYPEFYTPFTKTVTIRVVAFSGDNCFSQSTQTITLMASPQLGYAPLAGICADVNSSSLASAVVLNSLPGQGVYSGPGINAAGTFRPSVAGVGTWNIKYTFTGTNGCIRDTTQSVTVFPIPTVNAGADKFILEGGKDTLNAVASGSGLTYAWTPATYLSATDVLRPVTTPFNEITYTITVTSSDNCTASDQVYVRVLKAPTIPNVFTPNGDNVNDRWEIKYLDSYPGCTVKIFNRYGQQVFQSVGYSTPWDGMLKGSPLPAGTYYYIIDPKNGRQPISGFVDIVR